MDKVVHFEEQKEVRVPVEALWEFLSDSNHLNQYIGLFPVQFTPFTDEGGQLHRQAKAKAFGLIPLSWKEHTFSWVREEWYEVERVYDEGPVEKVIWRVMCEPKTDEASLLTLHGTFHYRNILGKWALTKGVIPQLRRTLPYVAFFEKTYHNKASAASEAED